MTEVREKRGLTYGIGTYLVNMDHADMLLGQFSASNDKVAEAIKVVRAEWAKAATEGVTEEELADDQDLSDRVLSAAVRWQRADCQHSGGHADGWDADRLCRHPEREDRGGDDGGYPRVAARLFQARGLAFRGGRPARGNVTSRAAERGNYPLPPAGPMVYQFGMIWTIPNSLTVLRLLAAPGVAIMFLYFHRPWADWLALTLFVGAAITDWFDGYLARLWKQESKFGAMLDPIADKAMVVIAIMVITGYNGMNPWLILPATLILFREVFVGGPARISGGEKRASEGHEAGQVEDHGADDRDRGAVPGNGA
jgi:hypothetical protein